MFELTRDRLRHSGGRGAMVVAVLLGAIGGYLVIGGIVVVVLRIEGHTKAKWAAIVILLFFATLLCAQAARSWRMWRSARESGGSPPDPGGA
jgi:hypothetical protein